MKKRNKGNHNNQKLLNYSGHIKLHNTVMNIILEGKVEEKETRGRRWCKCWLVNNIKKWSGVSVVWFNVKTRDKTKFKSYSSQSSSGRRYWITITDITKLNSSIMPKLQLLRNSMDWKYSGQNENNHSILTITE